MYVALLIILFLLILLIFLLSGAYLFLFSSLHFLILYTD